MAIRERLGFVGNLGMKKKINGWDLNADISYAQNVQSSLALYTTSNYNYGGYVRKRFGDFTYWTASYREVQTGLTQQTGYHNRSETALTTLNAAMDWRVRKLLAIERDFHPDELRPTGSYPDSPDESWWIRWCTTEWRTVRALTLTPVSEDGDQLRTGSG